MDFTIKLKEILISRLSDRNSNLLSVLEHKLEEMSGRGIFVSGITVRAVVEIIVEEAKASTNLIVETATECHSTYFKKDKRQEVRKGVLTALQERFQYLDKLKYDKTKNILDELSISTDLKELDLREIFQNLENDAGFKVDSYFERYEREKGKTFRDRLVASFLDNKLIAALSVIALAIIAIAGFIKALQILCGKG